jgi:hypothetical protein
MIRQDDKHTLALPSLPAYATHRPSPTATRPDLLNDTQFGPHVDSPSGISYLSCSFVWSMPPNRRKRNRHDGIASEALPACLRLTSSSASAKRRHVYLVARRIDALAGPFEFLSDGKFPLCHWGFVLSQHNEDQLAERFDRQAKCPSSSFAPLGTLFELKRYPDKLWQVTMDDKFGQALPSNWSRMCIVYIGETSCSDEEIIVYGIHVFQNCED